MLPKNKEKNGQRWRILVSSAVCTSCVNRLLLLLLLPLLWFFCIVKRLSCILFYSTVLYYQVQFVLYRTIPPVSMRGLFCFVIFLENITGTENNRYTYLLYVRCHSRIFKNLKNLEIFKTAATLRDHMIYFLIDSNKL